MCFFINSDSNLTRTQIFTLKLTPTQTLILNLKKNKQTKNALKNVPRFRFVFFDFKFLHYFSSLPLIR